MLDLHAAIHHHVQTGLPRTLRRFLVDNTKLHPDNLGANIDRILSEWQYLVGALKDLHNIYGLGNIT